MGNICISKFINYCASVSSLNIVTSGIHFHILRQQEKVFYQSGITKLIYWKTLFACNEKLTRNNTHTQKPQQLQSRGSTTVCGRKLVVPWTEDSLI